MPSKHGHQNLGIVSVVWKETPERMVLCAFKQCCIANSLNGTEQNMVENIGYHIFKNDSELDSESEDILDALTNSTFIFLSIHKNDKSQKSVSKSKRALLLSINKNSKKALDHSLIANAFLSDTKN